MLFLESTRECKSQPTTKIIINRKPANCIVKEDVGYWMYLVCLMPNINSSSLLFLPKRACQSEGFEDFRFTEFSFSGVFLFPPSSSESSSHPNSARNRSRCSTLAWNQWIIFEDNISNSRHNQQPRQYQCRKKSTYTQYAEDKNM